MNNTASRLTRAAMVTVLTGVSMAAIPSPAHAQDSDGDIPTVVLSKTYHPSDPDPAPGETITFTITLANDSAADATGYALEGLMPPEVVDPTWTCTATGSNSACGVASGTGDVVETADVAAGGTVVYVVTGTIAPEVEGEFVQAVTLVPGPGQACEPVTTVSQPEQYGDGYQSPPVVEPMTCRVNNVVSPEALPVAPPESDPGGPGVPAAPPAAVPPPPGAAGPPALPETGSPVFGYALGGAAALLLGAALLALTRRRVQTRA